MQLQDLKMSILSMEWEDQIKLHSSIQASRLTIKKKAAVRKKKVVKIDIANADQAALDYITNLANQLKREGEAR